MSKEKRGLLISRFPLQSGWGGEEELHILLADELRKRGISVHLWSSCPHLLRAFFRKKYRVQRAFLVPDPTSILSLLLLPCTLPMLLLQACIFLPFFRMHGCQSLLMLTFFEKCFLTPFALLCGYKVIWAHHAPFGNWFFKNPLLFLWKLWSRKVSIIVPSRAMKQECMNVWKNDSSSQAKCHHIFVVHNALPFFPSSSLEKRKEILSQIPFPSEPIIGTASRLSLGKNIFDFLDIAENLSKQNILIAGDGPEKEKLLQEIRSRNIRNVILLGHTERKDLSSFYKVLHIYCSCSTYETFGLSLLEAAHFGVPVVAPDVGGISEVVKNKCTGLLYERRNMLDARKKILELIKSPQMHKRMKEKSVEHAKKFSVGRFIHSMTTILFSA